MIAPTIKNLRLWGFQRGNNQIGIYLYFLFCFPFGRLGVRDHTEGPGGSLHTFSPERKYDRLFFFDGDCHVAALLAMTQFFCGLSMIALLVIPSEAEGSLVLLKRNAIIEIPRFALLTRNDKGDVPG